VVGEYGVIRVSLKVSQCVGTSYTPLLLESRDQAKQQARRLRDKSSPKASNDVDEDNNYYESYHEPY